MTSMFERVSSDPCIDPCRFVLWDLDVPCSYFSSTSGITISWVFILSLKAMAFDFAREEYGSWGLFLVVEAQVSGDCG